MLNGDQAYPGFASYVAPEARAMRDAMSAELRLKVMEISEMLALNPADFENRTQAASGRNDIHIYEHPDPSIQVTYQLLRHQDPKVIKFLHFAALKMAVKKTLFISYSHKDLEYLIAIKKFLRGLENQDLAIWDDQQIQASAQWRDEIDKALTTARAALLLVSQDFLTSEFITERELPFLLEKAKTHGLKVFWVPVRPSTVKYTLIASFQSAVDNPDTALSDLRKAKREQQFVRVYERIAAAMAASS